MKKNEVKVGETYRCKVSGSMADVRIVAENRRGGWDAINVLTNRKVRIKSAQRLRGKTSAKPGKKRIVTKAEYEAKAKAARKDDIAKAVDAVEKGDMTKGVVVPTGAKTAKKATKKPKGAAKRDTGERDAKGGDPDGKRLSGLDAAAKVLADVREPMNCKDLVERMLADGLWKTGGKTPANTLYAAILREINTKGDAARFRKVERGKFALAAKR